MESKANKKYYNKKSAFIFPGLPKTQIYYQSCPEGSKMTRSDYPSLSLPQKEGIE
jgi:hypothetical protein